MRMITTLGLALSALGLPLEPSKDPVFKDFVQSFHQAATEIESQAPSPGTGTPTAPAPTKAQQLAAR